MQDIDLPDFEGILKELGESRSSRIAYDGKTLSITTPLPEHEVDKVLVNNFVVTLLEELNRDFWSLGSTLKIEQLKKELNPIIVFIFRINQLLEAKIV